MELFECIKTRRSIRKYISGSISEGEISKILEAGMYAPSARNTRAWHFYVIQKKELLDKISHIHPYGKMIAHAQLGILVCGDRQLESNESYLAINCAAATQNILLAINALKLGAVWLGIYPRAERIENISNLLDLPTHHLPISLLSVGIPAEAFEIPERFEKEKITYL